MARDLIGAFGDLIASSGLPSALHAAFGGNTARMAQALGISQRSIQRYYTQSHERRAPSAKTRAKMARLIPTNARVQGQFSFDSPGFRDHPDLRQRDVRFTIEASDMARIQDALAAGNNELANEIFFEAYGMAAPDEVIGANYTLEAGGS